MTLLYVALWYGLNIGYNLFNKGEFASFDALSD